MTNLHLVYVNHNALGNLSVDAFHFHLLHAQVKLTTSLHTGSVTLNFDGDLNHYRLLLVDLEEIEVQDAVGYRMPLDVLQYHVLCHAVDSQLHCEYVGSVNELADVVETNHEVGSDDSLAVTAHGNHFLALGECALIFAVFELYELAAIEHAWNLVLGAQCFCGLLAKVSSWRCVQFKCLHFFNCVTQN